MSIRGQPKVFLRIGRLDREEQEVIVETRKQTWDKHITVSNDPFLRLTYNFLRENKVKIHELEGAMGLYLHLLAHVNWQDSDTCTYANLGEWYDAGFLVTVRTQKYMARELGTSISTIVRELSILEEEEWIKTIPNYRYLRSNGEYSRPTNVILLGYWWKVRNQDGETKVVPVLLSELKDHKGNLSNLTG